MMELIERAGIGNLASWSKVKYGARGSTSSCTHFTGSLDLLGGDVLIEQSLQSINISLYLKKITFFEFLKFVASEMK